MWDQVGGMLTGLAGLITAIGGLFLAYRQKVAAEVAACRASTAQLEANYRWWRVLSLRHINLLENELRRVGTSVPDRPDVMW